MLVYKKVCKNKQGTIYATMGVAQQDKGKGLLEHAAALTDAGKLLPHSGHFQSGHTFRIAF
jgi:hypothetical protein